MLVFLLNLKNHARAARGEDALKSLENDKENKWADEGLLQLTEKKHC